MAMTYEEIRAKLPVQGYGGINADEAARQMYNKQPGVEQIGTVSSTTPAGNKAAAKTPDGVALNSTSIAAGGAPGFFGQREDAAIASAEHVYDPAYGVNKASLGQRIQGLEERPNQTMQAANMGAGASMQAANMGAGATIATAPQDQFRGQQMNLAQQLGASAAGHGPSAAQDQLKLATDRNMSGALALALGARGGNQAGAMKQAQMQRALIGQEAAGQSGMLRAQEMQSAQQSLGQVLGAGRGADIGMATDQAGLAQQAAQANAGFAQGAGQVNAGLAQDAMKTNAGFQQDAGANNLQSGVQQQAQRDALIQSYMQTGMSLDQANMQADIQQRQFAAGEFNKSIAALRGVSTANSAQGMQMAGAMAQAAGTAMAASDRRAKTNVRSGRRALGELLSLGASISDEREKTEIRPATKALGELLSGVGSHEYEYKDPDKPLRGRGRFVSPMAQEIEQTAIGRSMVKTGPDGTKVVDYGKGLGAMLSGLGWLHERMERIEGARG